MVEQAAIAGTACEGTYSQTYTTGSFFVVLSLSGDKTVDKELGRNTLAKIEEMISQTPATTAKEIVEILSDEFKNGIKIDLSVAKIEGQKLTLAAIGNVGAKLLRKGGIVDLSTPEGQSAIRVVSGPVLQNDLIILATTGFFQLLETSDLANSQNQAITELRDALLPKVEGLADTSKIAALLIKVDLTESMLSEASDQALPPAEEPSTVLPTSNNRLAPAIAQFKSKYLRRIGSPRGLYLKSQYGDTSSPQFRKSIYLAIVVLISLVSLVAFQLRSRAIEESAKTIAAMDKQVQDCVDSAQKLSGVNDNIARDILLQCRKDFIAKAEASFGTDWQKSKSAEGNKLKTILVNLDTKVVTISHIYNVGQLSVFYDFGLLKSGAKVVSGSLVKNEIIALDTGNGAVYTVGTKTKTASIVIGSDVLKSARLADGNPDNSAFVLTGNGIVKIDRSVSPATVKQIIPASDKWGEIKGLKTFASNLYLLDTVNNQVWKYQGTDTGFGDLSPYLKSGSLDFSKVTSWAIDGYIYVLSGSGNVVRFASGYADEFKLSGLPDPLSNPSSIFASDETESIYILGGNKVIITNKKGVYLAEYILPSAVSGTVLADESVKKVFLVSGDKIFSFDHTSP